MLGRVAAFVVALAGSLAGPLGPAADSSPVGATTPPCPPAEGGMAWTDGPSVAATDLAPGIRAAVYPGPADTGNPWSQWGQGVVLDDGRFLSATGDHRGADGNSFLYEFDPATGRLTQISDVLGVVDHRPGEWGYGKIHAPLVAGPCGEVYAATYWGTRRDLVYGGGYTGDRLLRMDPSTRTITDLGVPAPGFGVPSMAAHGSTLYLEAVRPESDPDAGSLVAYDVSTATATTIDDDPAHAGFRALAVDDQGRVLFTKPSSRLSRYDPATGETTALPDPLPGTILRAATPPGPDGTIYAVTQGPEVFIAIAPDGAVRELGPAPGYVTSLAMTPDGATVFFVPGAHGDGWRQGTPVMTLDTATGELTTLAELNPLTEATLDLTAGGTYDVALDAQHARLFIGLNAGPTATREDTTFGEVVLVELDLTALGVPIAPSAATRPAPSSADTATGDTSAVPTGDGGCIALVPPDDGDGATDWVDVTTESGLDQALTGMMAHAAAWGDVDGDGRPDLFAGTFADRPPEEYRRRGADGPRPDVLLTQTDEASVTFDPTGPSFGPGRTSGALLVDLDLDGDLDLVASRNRRPDAATAPEPTQLWRNDAGAWTLVTDSGLDASSPGRSIGAADLDRDGRLDLVILEDRWRGGRSRLYRNLGGLRFEERGAEWGWPSDVTGLGVGTADLDADGHTDVVIGGSNRVFLGTGAGVSEVPGAITPWTPNGDEDDPAGVALGDVDGDGDPDLVIGQHYNSTIGTDATAAVRLYRNDTATAGGVRLTDITEAAGLIGLPTKAPHVALVDLDNDGRLDLLTSASADGGSRPAVFMATEPTADGTPRFTPPTGLGDDRYWVTGPTADVDGDGRLDVFLAEWDPGLPSPLLLNRRAAGHAVQVAVATELGGGPGTVVEVYEPGRSGDAAALIARTEISLSQGAFAGIEPVAHLGVGDRIEVDVIVRPPLGDAPITYERLPADLRVTAPTACP